MDIMPRMWKAFLAAVFIFSLVGCDVGERAKLEKENKDLKEAAAKNRAAVDYDLQAKCSKDARAWFKETWQSDKDTLLLDFTNHYHKGLNKCFVLVEYHYSYGDGEGSWMKDLVLYDVYENAKYGSFNELHISHLKPTIKTEVQINSCQMFDKRCKTAAEFNDWVQPFLSN